MPTYTLKLQLPSHPPTRSANVDALAEVFGLTLDPDQPTTLIEPCPVTINPGQVVYITGAKPRLHF